MELGAFSVSLAVKDIAVSRSFYERLGFVVIGGDQGKNWLVLRNGATTIGLFQDMFEKNILTFNPGWDSDSNEINPFTDIRDLQKALLASDIEIQPQVDPESSGPVSFMVTDPDGNQIMFDQHR